MIFSSFFFFNDPATTEIYTLSLHDALPIFGESDHFPRVDVLGAHEHQAAPIAMSASFGATKPSGPSNGWSACLICEDRKSTRLNSSHVEISYAVFCLKKKKKNNQSLKTILN